MSNILDKILENKQRVIDGKYQFMPFNFTGFNKIAPGMIIDNSILAGFSSAGKSSLMKFLYLQTAIQFAIDNNINYKVILFALEDTKEIIEYTILCYLYWQEFKEIIDIKLLEGMRYDVSGKRKVLSFAQELNIKQIMPKLKKFMSYIEVHDDIYNCTGIYKEVRKYAAANGTFYCNKIPLAESDIIKGCKWDTYEPNAEQFVSVIIDNANLLDPEAGQATLYDAIIDMSAKYGKRLIVKKFKYHFLLVQQMSDESVNLDHLKAKNYYPVLSGLGQAKKTGKDARLAIGITAPYLLGLKTSNGFDLNLLKGFYRCINIMKNTYGSTGDLFHTLYIPHVNMFYLIDPPSNTGVLDPTTETFIKEILHKIKDYENGFF